MPKNRLPAQSVKSDDDDNGSDDGSDDGKPQTKSQSRNQNYNNYDNNNNNTASSFDWYSMFHPCGDGTIIPFGTGPPQATIMARFLVKNCLFVAIFLILVLYFIKTLIHPCYGDCKSFPLMDGFLAKIPYIGGPLSTFICFFACLFINVIKFIGTGLSMFLGL